MGLTGPTLQRKPWVTYPWTGIDAGGGTGIHVVSNTWAQDPTHPLMETDNNVFVKHAYQHTPPNGQNPSVSTYWECWFRPPTGFETFYFVICNQSIIQVANAAIRGYGIRVVCGGGGAIDVVRIDGAGALVVLAAGPPCMGTDIHRIRMSREISGANRFWRLYYDDMVTPAAGPSATDATYTNFQYWGWDLLTNARLVFGGESCQS